MSIINDKSNVAYKIYQATQFRCYNCNHMRFVHEGTCGGDGMNCWWHGFCEKCHKQYEICESTSVKPTGETYTLS